MAEKYLAALGQHGFLAAAVEQAHLQNIFQFLDRFRYRRLGNGQLLRRLLQSALLDDSQKALQMAKLDAVIDHL